MICKRYEEVTNYLSSATVKTNLNGLCRIVAGILGIPKLDKGKRKEELAEWYKQTGKLPITKLTVANIERFQQRELAEVKDDFEKLGSVATTMNQYSRSARSVFAEKILLTMKMPPAL